MGFTSLRYVRKQKLGLAVLLFLVSICFGCSKLSGKESAKPVEVHLRGSLKQTLTPQTEEVRAVAFSGDSKKLAIGNLGFKVKLWDVQNGNEQLTKDISPPIAFSADSKTLASVDDQDTSIKLWDAQSGATKQTLTGHTGEITCVAFSGDSQTVASGSMDKTVKLWDARTGASTRTLSGHTDTILSVAISADNKTVASGGRDDTIKLWDARTGALNQTLNMDDVVEAVALSPDGNLVAGVGGKVLKVWDVRTGAEKQTTTNEELLTSVAFAPDGKLLACGSYDHNVRVWEVQTGELKFTLKGHTDVVESVAFSPDGKILASASSDKTVKLWE